MRSAQTTAAKAAGMIGSTTRPLAWVIRSAMRAPSVLALIWPMVLIVVVFVAHARWGRARIAEEFRGVEIHQISVSQAPPYVHGDVVETVYTRTGLDSLSLLDVDASAKIASAFALHPWVESVQNVRKLPGGGVDVRLRYREIIAMVRVFKPGQTEPYPYYFAVDGGGVLLPQSDFAPSQTLDYIHIDAPGAYSTSAVGEPFGDRRVEHAAALAKLLARHRTDVGIQTIHVHGRDRRDSRCQLDIELSDGASFYWGSPPGSEAPGEPDAASKLRQLLGVETPPS